MTRWRWTAKDVKLLIGELKGEAKALLERLAAANGPLASSGDLGAREEVDRACADRGLPSLIAETPAGLLIADPAPGPANGRQPPAIWWRLIRQELGLSSSSPWRGLTALSEAQPLVLPNGLTLTDATVVPRFVQDVLDLDPERLWRELRELRTIEDTEDIQRATGRDVEPVWVPGSHPALHYRGKPVPRAKLWAQLDLAQGLKVYRYTGFQWRIARATRSAEDIPALARVFAALRARNVGHNHAIVTSYSDREDSIGYHADKVGDFAVGSAFMVLKLGEPRRFALRYHPTEEEPDPEPLFDEELEPGTAVIVGCKSPRPFADANAILQHSVPALPSGSTVEPSGSIVTRAIATVFSHPAVEKRIRASEAARKKRAERGRPKRSGRKHAPKRSADRGDGAGGSAPKPPVTEDFLRSWARTATPHALAAARLLLGAGAEGLGSAELNERTGASAGGAIVGGINAAATRRGCAHPVVRGDGERFRLAPELREVFRRALAER
jgi:hypothetical protein